MNDLIIKGEKGDFFTPQVSLLASNGHCEISGESYLEYTDEFYKKILDWLKAYTQSAQKPIIFHFKLTYFNTSSFKGILSIFRFLKAYESQGGNITINWHYSEDDIDMMKEGQDLASSSETDVNFIPIESTDR